MKRLHPILMVLCLLLATPSMAVTLAEAKAGGLVGENASGYLTPLKTGNSEINRLVKGINSKRKTIYQQKAAKAGVNLQVMETRMGQRLKDRAKPGEYVQTSSGWVKK